MTKPFEMEHSFNTFRGFIASGFWTLVTLWIANIAIKGWRARRTFVMLRNQGLVKHHFPHRLRNMFINEDKAHAKA